MGMSKKTIVAKSSMDKTTLLGLFWIREMLSSLPSFVVLTVFIVNLPQLRFCLPLRPVS